MRDRNSIPIVVADDDMDDCEMIREAFFESRLVNDLKFVHNGEELLDWLHNTWAESQGGRNLMPGLILLDLNMPKMDGREVLTEMKKHSYLSQIPVIVLTTSQAEEDIVRSYNLGANSFITKPIEFDSLVQIMRDIGRYWFEIVALPDCTKGK